jgi:hypothetical protein
MATTTYTVERSTRVAAPPEALFREVEDFHRWPGWSPWEDLDPALDRRYSGADHGVGAVYEWSGNRKAGQGRMECTGAETPSRVVVDLHFLKPFKSSSTSTFSFVPDGDGTLATWTLVGPVTAGLRVMGLFTSMDKLLGGDFEKGLARLKAVAETGAAGDAQDDGQDGTAP